MIKQKSGSLTAKMSAVLGTMLANGEFNEEIENYSIKLELLNRLKMIIMVFLKNRSDIRKGRKT